MNLFSISDLQNYSGIKAHTIRIWEQRYGALKPERSEGNTRYYNGNQLRRLLNIVSLMNNGHKISELCSMPDEKHYSLLEDQMLKTISETNPFEYYISQIVSSALEFDEEKFNRLYSDCVMRFGISDAYKKVILPVLERFGFMWSKASLQPAQEHFISSLLRQKLLAAADSLQPAKDTNDTWLLFLPENEFHETGLLFSNFLLRHAGKKVCYLGANVPFDSLLSAIEKLEPANLLLFLIHGKDPLLDEAYLKKLSKHATHSSIHVACSQGRIKSAGKLQRVKLLHGIEDLETGLI